LAGLSRFSRFPALDFAPYMHEEKGAVQEMA
jgi:hypothetical protein